MFDVFTSVFDIEISGDTRNLLKGVSETCNGLIKKVLNIQISII